MTRRPLYRRLATYGARLVLLLVASGLGLGLCEVAARVFWPRWTEFGGRRFLQKTFTPGFEAGWAGRPGYDGYLAQNDGDFRVRIQLNALGMRNLEPAEAAGGKLWVVGDSFAFGWGVERDQGFGSVAGRLAGLAVYNLGAPGATVCGYETAVARMPTGVRPRAVIVGLTLENDITDYRCLRGKGPLEPTPGWSDEQYTISLLAQAKLYLMHYSALYSGLALRLKGVGVVERVLIAARFVELPHREDEPFVPNLATNQRRAESTADEVAFLRTQVPPGTPFAVLVIPARAELRDAPEPHLDMRRKVVAALEARGIPVIDPTDLFRSTGFYATHFRHDGHWSARGHEVAGAAVASWLMIHDGRAPETAK